MIRQSGVTKKAFDDEYSTGLFHLTAFIVCDRADPMMLI